MEEEFAQKVAQEHEEKQVAVVAKGMAQVLGVNLQDNKEKERKEKEREEERERARIRNRGVFPSMMAAVRALTMMMLWPLTYLSWRLLQVRPWLKSEGFPKA